MKEKMIHAQQHCVDLSEMISSLRPLKWVEGQVQSHNRITGSVEVILLML